MKQEQIVSFKYLVEQSDSLSSYLKKILFILIESSQNCSQGVYLSLQPDEKSTLIIRDQLDKMDSHSEVIASYQLHHLCLISNCGYYFSTFRGNSQTSEKNKLGILEPIDPNLIYTYLFCDSFPQISLVGLYKISLSFSEINLIDLTSYTKPYIVNNI